MLKIITQSCYGNVYVAGISKGIDIEEDFVTIKYNTFLSAAERMFRCKSCSFGHFCTHLPVADLPGLDRQVS